MMSEQKRVKRMKLFTILSIFSRSFRSSWIMVVMSSCTDDARSTFIVTALKAMLQTISS